MERKPIRRAGERAEMKGVELLPEGAENEPGEPQAVELFNDPLFKARDPKLETDKQWEPQVAQESPTARKSN